MEKNTYSFLKLPGCLVLVCFMFILFSCQGTKEAKQFKIWWYEPEDSAMAKSWNWALEELKKRHPDTEVLFELKAFEQIMETANMVLNSDDVPDIIQTNKGNATLGVLVKNRLLTSLEDIAKQRGWLDIVGPSFQTTCRYNEKGLMGDKGELWAITTYGEFVMVYYNYNYMDYAKQQLRINPLTSKTWHIHKWMYHSKTIGKGYNFIKDSKIALKRFFSFLVKTGYIKKNPAEALPRVKIPKSNLNKPLETKTIFKILESFHRNKWMGMRNFTIVSILWALGLRVNELLNMKRKDINLDYDPEHKTGTLLVHGKGGKERTLFIVDILFEVISCYLSLKKTPKRQGSLLFPGTKGKTIRRTRVRQLIMEAAKRTGITARVTPHVFRHTFATDMYNQNVPIEAIKEMMGHEKLRETSVYIHITDELQAEVLKKISIKENVS